MHTGVTGQVELEHRAFYMDGAPPHTGLVASSEEGRMSFLTANGQGVRSWSHRTSVRSIARCPVGDRIAIVDADFGILVLDSGLGTQLVQIRPPASSQHEKDHRGGYSACLFDEGGGFLWVVSRPDERRCVVQLMDTRDWRFVAESTVEDPFQASSCSLHRTGRPELVSLWLAAGDCGQQVYWLRCHGHKITCDIEKTLSGTTPPEFSPDGDRFVVLGAGGEVRLHEFGSMRLIGQAGEAGLDEDPFAESQAFLSRSLVLASTNNGRIFMLDAETMHVTEELIVAGHEPRPVRELYPELADDKNLCTDISYFRRLGKQVVIVVPRERDMNRRVWKDRLLWFPVSE